MPTIYPDGTVDLYIDPAKFRDVFAQDVPASRADVMAAAQRPLAAAAGDRPSGDPAWKTLPSWFINEKAYADAPADAGEAKHDSVFSPWWAIPGLLAATGAGYLGGKGIADWIGYGLRERPVKKRLDKAKQEFEDHQKSHVFALFPK